MGLFGSNKKTYVSSVAYPMGEDDGPTKQQFLKFSVLNANLTGSSASDAITKGLISGQGMNLRQAFRYARDTYTDGVPESAGKFIQRPDLVELLAVLQPKHPTKTITLLTTVATTADYEWYAERYLTEEFGYDRTTKIFSSPPLGMDAYAKVFYDALPGGQIKILLVHSDIHAEPPIPNQTLLYRPSDYVPMSLAVHCAYRLTELFDLGKIITTRPMTEDEVSAVYNTVGTSIQAGENRTYTTKLTIEVDPVTEITTVTNETTVLVVSRVQYFIYQLGSGTYPTLDAWLNDESLSSPYYPAIPLRVNNVDILKESYQTTARYKTSKKLLKFMGADIKDLREQINDIDPNNLKEIDYAFVVFGISLGVKSREGREYLFRYFQYLDGISKVGGVPRVTRGDFETWVADHVANGGSTTPPQMNAIEIYNPTKRKDNYDIKIQWNYIETTVVDGVVKLGAKKGDIEVEMEAAEREYELRNLNLRVEGNKLFFRKQISETQYEQIEIAGLQYENFIYNGKSVTIGARDVFYAKPGETLDEGFILPLNYEIFRSMSLVQSTDLAYHAAHMVFNSYKVVKKKWYQTGLFQVILIIIAIIWTVWTWGADGGAGLAAALGTTLATYIGTNLILMYIAATLYVLAAMVVANVISKAAVAVFGDKWGALIGMIIMIFVTRSAGSFYSTAANGTITMSASQIINASALVLKGYGSYLAQKVNNLAGDITKLNQEFKDKFEELERKMEEMLGTNTHLLDIQSMTDSTYQRLFEPMESFLGRTLLVGSDVAEITLGQIDGFASIGLNLPTNG